MKNLARSLSGRFTIIGKSTILLFAFLMCFCNNLSAGSKTNHTHGDGNASKPGSYRNTVNSKKKPAVAALPTISYSSPQIYTAGTAITPLSPTSSGVATPGYSSGHVALGSGFSQPAGVAADAAGNVYVADFVNNAVKKIPAGGGAPISIGSGFSGPEDVAVDGAGNVYVADYNNNAVKKIPAGGGSTVAIGSTFTAPKSVAVDASGNVYVSCSSGLYTIPSGSNIAVSVQVSGATIGATYGIAADNFGNIYVCDVTNKVVFLIPPAGSGSAKIFASGFSNIRGISTDPQGNVFVADLGSNSIKKIPAGGGSTVTIATGFSSPPGVAVDADGNVYVADQGNNAVEEIKPVGGYYLGTSLPAGLSFSGATGVISGTPSASSAAKNYTVTAYNSSGSSSATVNITVNLPPVPTISYSSPQTYTVATAITALKPASSGVGTERSGSPVVIAWGFRSSRGIAVGVAGNAFLCDSKNNTVVKIPAGGGAPVNIGTGFSVPTGVSVDAAGNVYVADGSNFPVKKIPSGGGATVALNSGIRGANSIAVDGAGNVYVADTQNRTVYKIPVGGGAAITLVSSIDASSLAVDGLGNIYIGIGTSIKKIPADGSPMVTLGSGLTDTQGIAIDGTGNIYIAETSGNQIVKIPAGSNIPVTFIAGLNLPNGVAADASGNIFVDDGGNNSAKKITPVGGYYISHALPQGLSFKNTNGTISGTPTTISAATNYTITAYNYGVSNSAIVNIKVNLPAAPAFSYTSPHTYNAGTAISPLSPSKSGGTVAAPSYSNLPVIVKSGFGEPFGLAVDAAGNVFVADNVNAVIKKIPVGGGAVTTVGTGFSFPCGVAVDASGNIYVADQGNTVITKIPVGGGTYVSLGSGFSSPTGVAVDAAGNVYVADYGNHAVKKIRAGGGAPVTIGSGFNHPSGIASDPAGNLYIVDFSNDALYNIPADGSGQIVMSTGFNAPFGVAVDPAGNVFVADQRNSLVKEIPVGGGSTVSIGSGFNSPLGVGVNAAGNIFVSDSGFYVKSIKPVGGYYIGPFLPAGLSFANSTGIISGTPMVSSPATSYTVTAYNAGGSGSATVNIKVVSNNASLANLKASHCVLSPAFAASTYNYTASVPNSSTGVLITPKASDAAATVKVNGTTVASGSPSGLIPLTAGPNTITTVVTASDGATTKTYILTITRAPSANADLANLRASHCILSPVFSSSTTAYTASVENAVNGIMVTPMTRDPTATVTVNGAPVTSGMQSPTIPLTVGSNAISVIVTAQDSTTTKTYTLTVTRAPSSNDNLSAISLTPHAALTVVSGPDYRDYTASVSNAVTSVQETPVTGVTTSTITVNGAAVMSGSASAPIALSVGSNTITTVVTAQDGVSTHTYVITITRAAGPIANALNTTVSVSNPTDHPQMMGEEVNVHQGLSPNGDGINDLLLVDGITNYPDNKLTIMNRSGQLIFVAKGYDNSTKVFDGHSNKTGAMQLPGTYFYSLNYVVNGVTKHKTGFIILKY